MEGVGLKGLVAPSSLFKLSLNKFSLSSSVAPNPSLRVVSPIASILVGLMITVIGLSLKSST